jgi:hypothetical protein
VEPWISGLYPALGALLGPTGAEVADQIPPFGGGAVHADAPPTPPALLETPVNPPSPPIPPASATAVEREGPLCRVSGARWLDALEVRGDVRGDLVENQCARREST